MSKIRGIFPLFLATAFGIGNGIWVFGPEFKAQQQEKDRLAKKALEEHPAEEPSKDAKAQAEILRQSEATASRAISKESALMPIETTSWWSKMSLWSTKSAKDVESSTKEGTQSTANK